VIETNRFGANTFKIKTNLLEFGMITYRLFYWLVRVVFKLTRAES
jgi:hypothetical protein